ncbi:Uu.00g015420.m01.CDS01 [Anthostomella pinea]|uniref:Uu.00g015420.m01.CDS01 n=1 Tax=Anthostomella pinea TaxID=933095 RepID=A0AAI8VZR2_9PEZI|nr:Uu.00g015420.m01.CDS01 [Anthostomella pinea]
MAHFQAHSLRQTLDSLMDASVGSLGSGNPPPTMLAKKNRLSRLKNKLSVFSKPKKQHTYVETRPCSPPPPLGQTDGCYENSRTELLGAHHDTDFDDIGSDDGDSTYQDAVPAIANDWEQFAKDIAFYCNYEPEEASAFVVEQLAAAMSSSMKGDDTDHEELLLACTDVPAVPNNSRGESTVSIGMLNDTISSMKGDDTDHDEILIACTTVPAVPNKSRRVDTFSDDDDDADYESDKWSVISMDTPDVVSIDNDEVLLIKRQEAKAMSVVPDMHTVNAKLSAQVDNGQVGNARVDNAQREDYDQDMDSSDKSVVSIDSAVAVSDCSDDNDDYGNDTYNVMPSSKLRKLDELSCVPDLDQVNAKLCAHVSDAYAVTPGRAYMKVHPRYAAKHDQDPIWRIADGFGALAVLALA